MPILNLQILGQALGPDGLPFQIPPPQGLHMQGPRINVAIGIARVAAEQLLARGDAVPAPVSGLALIDTGADCTCIDSEAARQLGLPAIDVGTMFSASHADTPVNFYAASIEIIGANIHVDASRAMGANLARGGLIALIGRDVLQHCVMVYNGLMGQITLCTG